MTTFRSVANGVLSEIAVVVTGWYSGDGTIVSLVFLFLPNTESLECWVPVAVADDSSIR